MPKHLIEEGTVVITGKNSEGVELTVEADVKSIDIEVINEYDPVYGDYSISTARLFKTRSDYVFHLGLKPKENGTAYIIKTKSAPLGVDRTARVEVARYPEGVHAPAPTLKQVNEAAKTAGVSEDIKFWTDYKQDFPRLETVVSVVFEWTT